jgi:hypothetical protein
MVGYGFYLSMWLGLVFLVIAAVIAGQSVATAPDNNEGEG